jgi:class 3 adenylate cyclase
VHVRRELRDAVNRKRSSRAPISRSCAPCAVNLASRLVNLARPNTVLLSDELGEGLQDDPRFELRPLRPVGLHGIGRVRPWVLRRARVA